MYEREGSNVWNARIKCMKVENEMYEMEDSNVWKGSLKFMKVKGLF